MESKLTVTKHNDLITASYRLTLTEMQIILYGASLINPIADEFPRTYEIDIKRFSRMFQREHNDVYGAVKTAIMSRFWEREFTFQDQYEKDKQGNKVRTRVRWITTVKYSDEVGFIKIFFNPEIQPYLHKLKKNFTSYYIEQVSKLKRFYSVRFYEISLMNLNKSTKLKSIFKMELKEIREIFEVNKKYKRFCDLKSRVLEPSRKEINKHSDITLNYEVIKRGRTPHEIKFTVTKKKPPKEQQISFDGSTETPKKIGQKTLEKAKKMTIEARTGWDFYVIEQQFYDFIKTKGAPDNLDGAFIGFVKKKIAKSP